ncbi:MAG: fused MFS/spermidine synthase [Desulfarculales bacterium]|nr:fused MFS/spermidine synthase [Desulfarculales bacterium]
MISKSPLYFLSFFCGAFIMGFELLGSRMLTPYFGSSIYVWGSLISVFMLGLAGGYFLGGLWADRHNTFNGLSLIIFIPALFITLSPWFYRPLLDVIFEWDLGPQAGPLSACLVLFTLPSLFLGMVSPYLVQLLVKQVRHVGREAGTLYAVSTCGSILGTLGTSFYLLANVGTRMSLLFMGISLLVLSLLAFALGRKAAFIS